MGIQVILFFSILFQLTAAGLALSLIRVTESHKRTWFFIAAAVLVMALRRLTILGQVLRDPDSAASSMAGELLALATSILVALFMLTIRPLLLAIHQAQEELKRRVEERTEQLSRTNAALQNEIALRQSEERFRTVFEYTPVSLWEEDLSGVKCYIDGLRAEGVTDLRAYLAGHPDALRACASRVKVLNVNQATLDLLGASSKEALPQGLAWLLDFQLPDVFIEEFAALAEGKTQFTSEEVRHTLRGEQINTILGISIAPGYEDTWGKVLVYVLDITERKRAEEALRASQAVQAAMIEAIPDLLFRISREGKYLAAYTHQAGLLAAPPGKLVGNTLASVLPSHVAQMAYDHLCRALETGETQAFEYALQVPEGLRHFEARFAVSGPDEVIAIVRDITSRKQAEDALATQQQYLRQIIDVTPSIIFIKDTEGRYTLANQAMADLAQVPVEDLVGRYDAEFTPDPHDRARREAEDRRVLETLQPLVIPEEEICKRRTGERRWFQVTKAPIIAPDSDEYHVLVVAEDITARKQAEEQAVALALEKERSRILSDFIRDTSHEFGTPLSVMRTSLYVLDQIVQGPAQQRHLQMANKQVKYIEDLVQGLLTMSRLDSGDTFAPSAVNLNSLIESVQERLAEPIEHKKLAFRLDLDTELPAINGDPKYLHVALENLVDNAIRYTPAEGAITIRTYCEDNHAVVEVQDTGIGIAKDQHELVFARFYRIDQARSDRGAGLGLPIARKIVDSHQGTITIDSAPGQGSTFRVFLPIPPG